MRNACLCLHLQQAARAVARRFDAALRPLGLTNGQFSLLMSLNRPEPPTIGSISALLAMDRTTLTANLKPLVRRGLAAIVVDEADKRSRRLIVTPEGRDVLAAAVPVWRETPRRDRGRDGNARRRPAARGSAGAELTGPLQHRPQPELRPQARRSRHRSAPRPSVRAGRRVMRLRPVIETTHSPT